MAESAAAENDAVLLDRRGHVLVITLNRPAVLNALDQRLIDGLLAAYELLAGDAELRAGVIAGAGRAFCAGLDRASIAAGSSAVSPETGYPRLLRHPIRKPLIAAVHGVAVGAGASLAMSCDLIVAERGSSFSLPEVALGIVAGGGGALMASELLPPKIAAEFLLTGDRLSGEDAVRWGMANRLVDAGQGRATAIGLAERLASNAPVAVQATKGILAAARELGPSSDEAWRFSTAEMARVLRTEDAAEGVAAMRERRRPEWVGR